ncbi:MAG: SDR family oxidoreductase [Chloroflexia bacterium]
MSHEPMLLLTGATGLVGSELLPHLLEANPDRQIIVLTRPGSDAAALDLSRRIKILHGDITQPRLALDDEHYVNLQNGLNEIIHCAAETRFGLPLEQIRATNTEGTRNLLKLAGGCRKLEKFAHVSTVFIVGRSMGHLTEMPLRHSNGFCNTYQQSKYEAEDLIFEAMQDIPIAIFRFSSLIGNSETGRVRQFNYVHRFLRVFPRNVLPMAPGDPAAPIDLIPTDWAIPALAYLFDRSFVPGRIYHICAGPDASLTVREMLDLTLEAFETNPRAGKWLPIHVPRLVSLAKYEEYVGRSVGNGDVLLDELLKVLGFFVPHLGMFQAFDNRHVQEALAGSGLLLPPIRDYYGKVIDYCLETNWGFKLHPEKQPQKATAAEPY